MLRDVRVSKRTVKEVIHAYGFRSRSSFYAYWKQFRHQGLLGLFDLRIHKPIPKPLLPDFSFEHLKSRSVYRSSWQSDARYRPSLGEPPCPASSRLYGDPEEISQGIRALNEGIGIRGTSRIFGVDKNTVLHWVQVAGRHCQKVSDAFLQKLHVEECQIDELWSFVKKKEKNLSDAEREQKTLGDVWIFVAFDPQTKLLVAYQMGKRSVGTTKCLLATFKARTDGFIPFFTSDDFRHFPLAILCAYGIKDKTEFKAPPELIYAIVKKKRHKGRVVSITVKVAFGSEEDVRQRIQCSSVSRHVNIAFVERSHLTRRHYNKRLCRKTLSFSKTLENHVYQFEIERALYHFCRPHRGLKQKKPDGGYQFITPMMATGKTDHVWSVKELLSFRMDETSHAPLKCT